MISLKEQNFRHLASMEDFIASTDKAFKLYGEGVLQNPPRREKLEGKNQGILRFEMPAYWSEKYVAKKIIEERTEYGKGVLGSRSVSIEWQDIPHQKTFLLDGEYITNMRTGASGALAVNYISRERPEKIAIIGAGRIGKALMLASDILLRPRFMHVARRTITPNQAFDNIATSVKAIVQQTTSLSTCLEDADIVFSAVPTSSPILTSINIAEKSLLCIIAGDPRCRQVSPELFEKRKIIADHWEQAKQSGEFLHASAHGQTIHPCRFNFTSRFNSTLLKSKPNSSTSKVSHGLNPKSFIKGEKITVSDIACRRYPQENAPLLIYLTGLAVHDLMAARMIIKKFG